MTLTTSRPSNSESTGKLTGVAQPRRLILHLLGRYLVIIALVGIVVYFSLATPSFTTGNNLSNILSQSALLAIVATAMTVVVRAGGIDLSVGVALDLGAMVAVGFLQNGYIASVAVVAGLLTGVAVGVANAVFILVLRISPFLATLATLFIGESIQQVVTSGGNPTYLLPAQLPAGFNMFGKATVAGLDVAIAIAAVVLLVGWFLLERFRVGRALTSVGAQGKAALASGIAVRRVSLLAYVFSATLCALTGIILASRLSAYIPLSGGYYMLDSIAVVFIGTTLHREYRPNLPGTLLGVLVFGVLTNGLNLMGVSADWQGAVRGLVLLGVLGLTIVLSKRRAVS
ncbi:ABC transporter permease [Streptomyces sp. NPDC000880]